MKIILPIHVIFESRFDQSDQKNVDAWNISVWSPPSDIFAYKKDLIDDDLLGFFENCLFELILTILTILDNIWKALGYILNQHMATLALSSHVQNGDIIFLFRQKLSWRMATQEGN